MTGPFATYRKTLAQQLEPGTAAPELTLCVGPWAHGQWSGGEGLTALGNARFGAPTEETFRAQVRRTRELNAGSV